MKFLFNKGVVGIEIGSDSVRVGKVRKTLSGFLVDSFGFERLPEGFFNDGLISEENKAAQIIRQTLEKAGISETEAAISLNSRFTFFKKVKLTNISIKMFERIYIFEAAHHFPFSLKDFTVDYHILKKEGRNISVLFTAARNEVIKNRIDIVKLAGLNPSIIEPDVLSVLNLYNFCFNKGNKENSAILKTDNDCSFIIFPDETEPSIRFIPYGKDHLEGNDPQSERDFLSSVYEEIRIGKIKNILLTGEDIPHGIIDYIKLKTANVSYFQPFNHMGGKKEFIRHSSFTVPLGLSMRRAGDK